MGSRGKRYRCTSCGSSVESLRIQRGGADSLCDPYIEHPITVLLIDLLLAKTSVYIHLLFNRANFSVDPATTSKKEAAPNSNSDPSLRPALRLSLAILVAQAYIAWSRRVLATGLNATLESFAYALATQTLRSFVLLLSVWAVARTTSSLKQQSHTSEINPSHLLYVVFLPAITELLLLGLSLIWRDVLALDWPSLHQVFPAASKLTLGDDVGIEDVLLLSLEILGRTSAIQALLRIPPVPCGSLACIVQLASASVTSFVMPPRA